MIEILQSSAFNLNSYMCTVKKAEKYTEAREKNKEERYEPNPEY